MLLVNIFHKLCSHIASRQDQYAVSVLLLSRGAKIGEVNSIGETAIDCCKAAGNTLNALQLNYKLNQRADKLSERTVRILTKLINVSLILLIIPSMRFITYKILSISVIFLVARKQILFSVLMVLIQKISPQILFMLQKTVLQVK